MSGLKTLWKKMEQSRTLTTIERTRINGNWNRDCACGLLRHLSLKRLLEGAIAQSAGKITLAWATINEKSVFWRSTGDKKTRVGEN